MRAGMSAGGAVVAVSLSLAGILGSCSSAAPHSAADQSFLAEVHQAAPDVSTYRTDVQLVRLGHAACDAFRSGASYEQLADRMALLEGRNPLPSQDLGAVITASVDAYCPQFRSKV